MSNQEKKGTSIVYACVMQWSRPATQHRNLDYSPNTSQRRSRKSVSQPYSFRLFISSCSLRRTSPHLVLVLGTTSHTHIFERPVVFFFSESHSFADRFSDYLQFFSLFTCSLLVTRVFWFEPRGTREPPGYLLTSDCSPSNSTLMRTRSGRLHTNKLVSTLNRLECRSYVIALCRFSRARSTVISPCYVFSMITRTYIVKGIF
ncbi:hypothetical protein F4804DRAFT_214855 [Jackrogersella minutella]|nr:hypothetical protein F4804DRAFT_214855 [Jackrogersella minutella]